MPTNLLISSPILPRGRSLALICATVASWALCVVIVSLRLYLRARRRNQVNKMWGWDDNTAFAGLVGFTILCSFAIYGSFYGFGIPPQALSDGNIIVGVKYLYLSEATYFVAQSFIKTSIGITVLRTICTTRRHKWVVYIIITATAVIFMGFFFWLLASCRPVAAHWDPSRGTCNYGGYAALLHLISFVVVATDLAFTLMLIWAIWNLHMPARNKYALIGVFSIGVFAVVASAVRWTFVWVMLSQDSPWFLYQIFWIALFTIIECTAGLLAGSMPFLGILFHLYKTNRKDVEQVLVAGQTIGGTPFTPPRSSDSPVSMSLVPRGLGENSTCISSPCPAPDGRRAEAAGPRERQSIIVQETSFEVSFTASAGQWKDSSSRDSGYYP